MTIEIEQVLALDYYDGPVHGVLTAVGGHAYLFEVVAVDDGNTDVRRYCLARFPMADALAQIEAILAPYISVQRPVWVPNWKFPDAQTQRGCERRIDEVLKTANEYSLELVSVQLTPGRFPVSKLSTQQVGLLKKFMADRERVDLSEWTAG